MDEREKYGRLTVLYGARRPRQTALHRGPGSLGRRTRAISVLVTVDRGDLTWRGNVGVVTTLFPHAKLGPPDRIIAAVVGPPVMYRFVLAELHAALYRRPTTSTSPSNAA